MGEKIDWPTNDSAVLGGEREDSNGNMKAKTGESPDEPKIPKSKYGRWGIAGDLFFGVESSSEKITPGYYTCHQSQQIGPYFKAAKIRTDSLIQLPDAPTEQVLERVDNFTQREAEFRKRGFLFKLGILLYGPPGSGKTVTLVMLTERWINSGNVVARAHNASDARECLKMFRHIEEKRRILLLLEDFDGLIGRGSSSASEFLALLDGEDQIDNVVVVATTNNLDAIPWNFTDRPSRFDSLIEISFPTAKARRAYLLAKEPSFAQNEVELEAYVNASENFPISHLRELIIGTKIYGEELGVTVARLRRMRSRKHPNASMDDSTARKAVGFG